MRNRMSFKDQTKIRARWWFLHEKQIGRRRWRVLSHASVYSTLGYYDIDAYLVHEQRFILQSFDGVSLSLWLTTLGQIDFGRFTKCSLRHFINYGIISGWTGAIWPAYLPPRTDLQMETGTQPIETREP